MGSDVLREWQWARRKSPEEKGTVWELCPVHAVPEVRLRPPHALPLSHGRRVSLNWRMTSSSGIQQAGRKQLGKLLGLNQDTNAPWEHRESSFACYLCTVNDHGPGSPISTCFCVCLFVSFILTYKIESHNFGTYTFIILSSR